jgi:DNA-binding MarR family transcriptional regulator
LSGWTWDEKPGTIENFILTEQSNNIIIIKIISRLIFSRLIISRKTNIFLTEQGEIMNHHKNSEIEWLFRTLDRMRHKCIRHEFEKRGLTEASHPPILFKLRYEMKDKKATQKEIADAIGISPPTVAVSIKRMEKAGLVRKLPDKTDLRQNIIELTSKGDKLLEECKSAFEKIDQKMFEGFSEQEIIQLKDFYIRLIRNLEEMYKQQAAGTKKGALTYDKKVFSIFGKV